MDAAMDQRAAKRAADARSEVHSGPTHDARGSTKPIYVTEPSLPPLEEFIPYLRKIWDSKRLTNNGPFHQELERASR